MLIVIWLHIATMVMGFAALISHDLVLLMASKIPPPESAKSMVRSTAWIGNVGKILVVIGIILGLQMARSFGLTSGWLLWTYALTAISILLGAAAFEPLKKQILMRVIDDRAAQKFEATNFPHIVLLVNPVLWIVILWLMVAKPGV